MKSRQTFYLILLVMILALASCSLNTPNELININENSPALSSILISLGSSIPRTIQPDISLEITSYDISGIGPEDEAFQENDFSGEELEVLNLIPGQWSVYVHAKNSDGILIGIGGVEIELLAGKSNSIIVDINPIAGTGSVDLTLTWPEGMIDVPIISAQFGKAGSELYNVEIEIGGNIGTYSAADLDDGYYQFLFTLFDGEVVRYNHAELVRVLNSYVSSGIITIDDHDLQLKSACDPVFSLSEGTYQNPQTVIISSNSPGTRIRYTSNGTIPTPDSGLLYESPILIESTQTIRAVAFGEDYNTSKVSSSTYQIEGSIALPRMDIDEGFYFEDIEVELFADTPGSLIVYTLDGSTPVPGSHGIVYISPITISSTLTLKAVAYSSNDFDYKSSVSSADYIITGYVAPPVFSIESGTFNTPQSLEIDCSDVNAAVYYTVDGSTPSKTNGNLYSGVFQIDNSTILKAVAIRDNWCDSPVVTGEYTLQFPEPVFTVPEGTYNSEQTVEILLEGFFEEDYNIYYTLDDSSPIDGDGNPVGNRYSSPINIQNNGTQLSAAVYSKKTGWESSEGISAQYVYKAPIPWIIPEEGTISESLLNVHIESSDENCIIKYTLDGSDPDLSNGIALDTFNINQDTIIKAVALRAGWEMSEIVTCSYILNPSVITPVNNSISLDTSPDFSWSGYYDFYDIQLASDSSFSNIVEEAASVSGRTYSPADLVYPGTYYWRVRPVNTWGSGEWYGGWKYSVECDEIIAESPVNGSSIIDTTPQLNWNDIPGAVSYNIHYSTIESELSAAPSYNVDVSTYQVSTVIDLNDILYWQVQAVNEDGIESVWSDNNYFTVNWTPVLGEVVPIDLSESNDTSPLINWNDIEYAVGYQIRYASEETTLEDAVIHDVELSEFQYPFVLALGETVYWQVRAVNEDGVSSDWLGNNSFTVEWDPDFTGCFPENASTNSDTSPVMDWADIPLANSFQIRYAAEESALEGAVIYNTELSEFQYPDVLALGETLYWQIRAVNDDGVETLWSDVLNFTVEWTPDFTGMTPQNNTIIADTAPLLDWGDDSYASSYKVRYSTDETSLTVSTEYNAVLSEYQVDSVLGLNDTLFWQVKAVNADGVESVWSTVSRFTINFLDMVFVEGGSFTRNGYDVSVSSLFVSRTEVLFSKWNEVYLWALSNGYTFQSSGRDGSSADGSDNKPVTNVSWRDAIVWCNALSEYEGLMPIYQYDGNIVRDSTDGVSCDYVSCIWELNGYRLPTEAEWEFAASGGTLSTQNTIYSGSDILDEVGWCESNCEGAIKPAGLKLCNELVIYDMSGNVSEWCWDWYDPDYYAECPVQDPVGPLEPLTPVNYGRVVRGGDYQSNILLCKVVQRQYYSSYYSDSSGSRLGFRIVHK